jgi:predicted secreted protein
MSVSAGKDADLYVGASPSKVAGLNSVKFSAKGKELDVSDFSAASEQFIGGLLGYDMSAAGFYDNADTSGQIAIRTALGSTIAFEVRWGATAPKVAGTMLVTAFDIDASVSGPVTVSITGKVTGAVTFS